MKRRIDFYNISKRLNPRVHELDGKNVIRALSSLERVGSHTRRNFYKYFGQPKRKKIFSFFFTFQMILNNFQFCREKIFRNFSKCLSGAGPVCGWLSSVNGRIALLPGTPPALGRVGSQHRPTPDKIFTSILVSQNGKKYFRFFSRFRWFWTTFNFAGKKFSEIFPSVCRGPDRCADGVALLPGNSRGGGGSFFVFSL